MKNEGYGHKKVYFKVTTNQIYKDRVALTLLPVPLLPGVVGPTWLLPTGQIDLFKKLLVFDKTVF